MNGVLVWDLGDSLSQLLVCAADGCVAGGKMIRRLLVLLMLLLPHLMACWRSSNGDSGNQVSVPAIVSFLGGRSTISLGSSTTLMEVYSGGTGSIDHGVYGVPSRGAGVRILTSNLAEFAHAAAPT